ncbi:hypothetical protein RFI_15985, partial [Reticulomyxa filosa]
GKKREAKREVERPKDRLLKQLTLRGMNVTAKVLETIGRCYSSSLEALCTDKCEWVYSIHQLKSLQQLTHLKELRLENLCTRVKYRNHVGTHLRVCSRRTLWMQRKYQYKEWHLLPANQIVKYAPLYTLLCEQVFKDKAQQMNIVVTFQHTIPQWASPSPVVTYAEDSKYNDVSTIRQQCVHCASFVPKAFMSDHCDNICPNVLIQCQLCFAKIPRCRQSEHWAFDCPEYKIVCRHCKSEFVGRSNWQRHQTCFVFNCLIYVHTYTYIFFFFARFITSPTLTLKKKDCDKAQDYDNQRYSYWFAPFDKNQEWMSRHGCNFPAQKVWVCQKCSQRNMEEQTFDSKRFKKHFNIQVDQKNKKHLSPTPQQQQQPLPKYNICELCMTPQFRRLFQVI